MYDHDDDNEGFGLLVEPDCGGLQIQAMSRKATTIPTNILPQMVEPEILERLS